MPMVATLITKYDIETSPQLILEVTESSTLPKGTQYQINAAGYINSSRNAHDGCVYMGTSEHSEITKECPNDIVVSSDELGMGGIHLLIQFKAEKKEYYMRDCGQGTGTFIKI